MGVTFEPQYSETNATSMWEGSYFPDFDGSKDSTQYNRIRLPENDAVSDNLSQDNIDNNADNQSMSNAPDSARWKNDKYYKLPPNVRKAIDIAELK